MPKHTLCVCSLYPDKQTFKLFEFFFHPERGSRGEAEAKGDVEGGTQQIWWGMLGEFEKK